MCAVGNRYRPRSTDICCVVSFRGEECIASVSGSERDAGSRLREVLFPTIPNLHHNAAGKKTVRTLTQ